ncbi:NAD(P)H-dependent oxidoreductase [Citreicella sp. C3M06]|uniref:NADPH-dependent FMN reductase n=1 Tax=Citreicella sp. C3M06 TaxID=2841564 RepID=UPI001C0A43F6|nr:NAD(P)H-dependent oxidoreductase [Citreicella sp. C3M06]MBU2962109.1 NAD(P)H-dependent oxidoreductase [Citreicella sp. C3M06]
MSKHVAVLVGSLRDGSFNRKLACEMARLAPDGLEFSFVRTGELPLYNPDLDEGTPPEAWTAFRRAVGRADAVMFVTPEYNRSVPANLKNALDVGSRPIGNSVWDGKPSAVVSGSMGAIGGFGANHHLRQSLVALNAAPMQQPEAYIGAIHTLFDEQGTLKNADTKAFLASFMAAFATWIGKLT